MKSVYESYPELWKGFDRPELKALLSSVQCLLYPKEMAEMLAVKNQQQTVVVIENGTLKQIAELIQAGFEHIVQASRPDFAQELLAATLMAARFEAFTRNPIPFFLSGFKDPSTAKDPNLTFAIKSSLEKTEALDKLSTFLEQSSRLSAVADLCVQAADEMISNAIYSAPIDNGGMRTFQDFDRSTAVQYPAGKSATLFASFSDYRVIMGVEDPYGSLGKSQFNAHLNAIFENDSVTVKRSLGGAGIGIRFMIDNAANFYVYSDKKKRTVFACGFLLKGVKANLTVNKHIHCSFR